MSPFCPAALVVGRIVAPHRYFAEGLTTLTRHLALVRSTGISHLLLLSGDTGAGKSFLLETFLVDTYKEVPEPVRTGEGIELKAAVPQMPPNPTPKGLYAEILRLYEITDIKSNDTAADLKRRTIAALKECKTEILAIEEVQHLTDRTTLKTKHHVDDIFKVLHDSTPCLMVLSGLADELEAVVASNKQLVTRVRGHIHLPRFDWNKKDHRAEFIFCLEQFKDQIEAAGQSFPDLNNTKLKFDFRLYCATGGIMRLLANLLEEVLSTAGGSSCLNLEDFENAYHTFRFRPELKGIELEPFSTGFLDTSQHKLLNVVKLIGSEELRKKLQSKVSAKKK